MSFFPASTDIAALSSSGPAFRAWRPSPAATIGRLQVACRELRLDYCRERGIAMSRRATGGGALYVDQGQIAFSAALRTSLGAPALLERTVRALIGALQELGARGLEWAAPNDISIGGRKLASAFLAREGDAVLIEGTVLQRVSIQTMLEALAVPTEKLSRDGLASARDRLVTLDELGCVPELERFAEHLAVRLGNALAVDEWRTLPAPPGPAEEIREVPLFSAEGTLEAIVRTPGAVLRAQAVLDNDGRLADVAFAMDGHLLPARRLDALPATLRGLPPDEAASRLAAHLSDAELVGFSTADVVHALDLACAKARFSSAVGLQRDTLMLFTAGEATPEEILAKASVMLIPYCAKPAWCKFRRSDDDFDRAETVQSCVECGLCEVGEAYELARERGMRAVTIRRYEHLEETLAKMRRDGIEAYVGMCCSQFFTKRHRAFGEAGIPAVLADITGANCYELKQESDAYAGEFMAEARLDLESLRSIMRFVPRVKPRQ